MPTIYAGNVEEGRTFIWRGDSYVVKRHEPNTTIVEKTVIGVDRDRHEEHFSPYLDVEVESR